MGSSCWEPGQAGSVSKDDRSSGDNQATSYLAAANARQAQVWPVSGLLFRLAYDKREARLTLLGESRLHGFSYPDRLVVCVEFDIAPAHDLAMADVVLQLQAMCEPDRQGAGLEARRRR